MSTRSSRAGAAAATAIAFTILIALGIWQLHRRGWKQDILAQIDAAETAPPRPLTDATPPLFTRVTASGTLRGAPFALYGSEVQGNRPGANLLEIMDRPGDRPLLVNLGWVPTDTPPHPVTGPATIAGYIRLPTTPTWLSATDDPEARRFYTLNPGTIAPTLGAPDAAPFTLVAMGPTTATPPIPAEALPRPPNNHLQYAFTWFGLAAALLGVFGAWWRKPAS